jgi:hypothetical protein
MLLTSIRDEKDIEENVIANPTKWGEAISFFPMRLLRLARSDARFEHWALSRIHVIVKYPYRIIPDSEKNRESGLHG